MIIGDVLTKFRAHPRFIGKRVCTEVIGKRDLWMNRTVFRSSDVMFFSEILQQHVPDGNDAAQLHLFSVLTKKVHQLLTAHTEHAAGHHRLDCGQRWTTVEAGGIVAHEFAHEREPCDVKQSLGQAYGAYPSTCPNDYPFQIIDPDLSTHTSLSQGQSGLHGQ